MKMYQEIRMQIVYFQNYVIMSMKTFFLNHSLFQSHRHKHKSTVTEYSKFVSSILWVQYF